MTLNGLWKTNISRDCNRFMLLLVFGYTTLACDNGWNSLFLNIWKYINLMLKCVKETKHVEQCQSLFIQYIHSHLQSPPWCCHSIRSGGFKLLALFFLSRTDLISSHLVWIVNLCCQITLFFLSVRCVRSHARQLENLEKSCETLCICNSFWAIEDF